MDRRVIRCLTACLVLLPSWALAAPGEFVEDEVQVLHTLEGEAEGDQFGWAVSELADIDGDGASEVIVGAPNHSEDVENSGRTYVYSGATGAPLFSFSGGPGGTLHGYAMADAGDVDGDGTHDIVAGAPGDGGKVFVYSGASGEQLHELTSEGMQGFLGAAVSSAGDVDEDGFDDVIVGAPLYPSLGEDGGRVYLFSGASGQVIRSFDADAPGAKFGSAVAYLGDVDGDDIPDQLVGARDAGESMGGRVYVYSGADGALIEPIIEADDTGMDLAWFFVAGLGDLDGDDIPEIYAGDFANAARGQATGRAYVYSGATHEALFTFTGAGAGEGMGPGRRGGDIDGDGVPDVVACSYSSSIGAPSAGQLSLFSGADGSLLRTITSAREGETLGFDAVTLGDVDGDGVDDLAASGATLNVVYIFSGAVTDGGETDGTSDTSDTGDTGSTGDGSSSTGDAPGTTSGGGSDGGGATTTAGPEPTTGGEETGGGIDSATGGEQDGAGCSCQQITTRRVAIPWLVVYSILLGLMFWRPRARRRPR